jgi:hypothetical protein
LITGLTNGITYPVNIRAINSVGNGNVSAPVNGTPTSDAIIGSLTTSLSSYNAAGIDDWVNITSTEWSSLQTNITGTVKAGIVDTYLSTGTASGFTGGGNSALIANGVTVNTPAILANRYIYGFALRWPRQFSGTDIRVFANTNTGSNTGFNQVGNVLPATTVSGTGFATHYYVRKGVSTTNGGTNGLLSVFTGTTPADSGNYIGFYLGAGFNPNAPMKYLKFSPANTGNPSSSSVLSGNLPNYGMFAIQALTTSTKQWD